MNTVDVLCVIFSFGIVPLTIGVWAIAWRLKEILDELKKEPSIYQKRKGWK